MLIWFTLLLNQEPQVLHRSEAVLRDTCTIGILVNEPNKQNYFKGVTVLQKLLIEQKFD